ncbi:MAG: VCBS repeat-containing protein, partial [Candidatus Midichloria sp.]|nr:VCBS repeat-containing protein [Candidatus Midichloria sp.]
MDFEIFTYGIDPNPWGVAVADFNNDNKLDIITAHRAGANIGILLGNGNGGFQPARYHSTGTGPVGITTADLNFDGNMDIINTCLLYTS